MTAATRSRQGRLPRHLVEKTGQLGGAAGADVERCPARTVPTPIRWIPAAPRWSPPSKPTARSRCTSTRPSPRPPARRGVSRRISAPKVGQHQHRKLRRHYPGLRCHTVRRQQAAGTRLRQEQGRGRSRARLEQLAIAANGGPIKRPSDGKEVKKVTFVQCAGQRSRRKAI